MTSPFEYHLVGVRFQFIKNWCHPGGGSTPEFRHYFLTSVKLGMMWRRIWDKRQKCTFCYAYLILSNGTLNWFLGDSIYHVTRSPIIVLIFDAGHFSLR
jgi:hypothetical protein